MSQMHSVGAHATTIATDAVDGKTRITYHQTVVVTFGAGEIVLNTGGYETVTTKTRMNQASHQFNLGYSVYQKDWQWYVDYRGETFTFEGRTLTLTH